MLADVAAHGGDHRFNRLSEASVGFGNAVAQALIGGAGFLGDPSDAIAQVGEFAGEFVELALGVAA